MKKDRCSVSQDNQVSIDMPGVRLLTPLDNASLLFVDLPGLTKVCLLAGMLIDKETLAVPNQAKLNEDKNGPWLSP